VIWVISFILAFVVFPFFFLISFLVFLGSLVRVSSVSWFGVWGGLELNIMSFLPIVMHFSRFLRVEAVVKYFLVQSFGRVGVLMGGLFLDSFFYSSLGFVFFFLFCSLFLKVGVFPFHWWVPGVLGGVSWFGVLVLSTWQKIAPVFVFSFFGGAGYLFLFVLVVSSVVGGVGGVGQTRVRHILAYSSIGHSGWFISLFCLSFFFGSFYFFVYFFRTFFLIVFFWAYDYVRTSQFIFGRWWICMVLMALLFTVSGLPPFIGFFSKLFAFFEFGKLFLGSSFFFLLLVGSVVSLYFYLGLFFSCFFLFSSDFITRFPRHSWFFPVSLFFLFSCFSFVFVDFFFLLF